jgi:hypothetical protein
LHLGPSERPFSPTLLVAKDERTAAPEDDRLAKGVVLLLKECSIICRNQELDVASCNGVRLLDWLNILSNQSIVLNGLNYLLIIFSLILIPVTLFAKSERSNLSLKLQAIFIVTSLCFIANNAAVYGIAVFIVATSITSLDFLEKLAAIVWRNDKYWDYKLQEASFQEKFDKTKKEVQSEVENLKTGDGQSVESVVNKALLFEDSALNTLVTPKHGLFYPQNLKRNMKIFKSGTIPMILDGLSWTEGQEYIIEVSYVPGVKSAQDQIEKMRKRLNYYQDATGNRYVRGLLILPSNTSCTFDIIDGTIGVLKYDQEKKEFVNRSRLYDWIWRSP